MAEEKIVYVEREIEEKERTTIDGKTIVVGGGIVALILWLLFRGRGGGNKTQSSKPLTFTLRADGLWLGDRAYDYDGVAMLVRAGGRNDIVLKIPGDIPQGVVDETLAMLKLRGISVYHPQPIASIYQRGRSYA